MSQLTGPLISRFFFTAVVAAGLVHTLALAQAQPEDASPARRSDLARPAGRSVPARPAGENVLLRAVKDELRRSLDELSLGDEPRPYFVALRIDELEVDEAEATLGALLEHKQNHARYLSVEVRVGSPSLDNTNFFSFPSGRSSSVHGGKGVSRLALDDDYRELRRQIWLLTDAAYKSALENLARKKASLKSRQLGEDLPDFPLVEVTGQTIALEQESVSATEAPTAPLAADWAAELARQLSAGLRGYEQVESSRVFVRAGQVTTRYFNSEGAEFARVRPVVEVTARAASRAADGRPLEDTVLFFGRSQEDLPSDGWMTREVTAMGLRLRSLAGGVLLERYNGPVLFEDQAAAEMFLQGFAPRLVAVRQPVAEDPRIEERLRQLGGGLNDKLNGRVLPRFIRLVDDPTLEEHDDQRLMGSYRVDDEAVPAGPTTLVERGILKTLLSGRNPSPGVTRTSANTRGSRVLPSNLVLSASQTMTAADLRAELLALVADRELEYGVVVRRIANSTVAAGADPDRRPNSALARGQDPSLGGLVDVVKLYPDGREEIVRNVEIAGVGIGNFKDIVAASDKKFVYSAPFGPGGPVFSFGLSAPGLGNDLVSVVTPSLLFEDLTLKTTEGPVPTLPIVPPPAIEPVSASRR